MIRNLLNPALLLAISLAAPLHATVSITLPFGPLTDSTPATVPDGTLWVMVYDEDADDMFPGGLGANQTLSDTSAAHGAFSGVTLTLNGLIDGDRIVAMGEVDSLLSGFPGVTFDNVVLSQTLVQGRKWAIYWFPGRSLASPTIPSSGTFQVGGLNEMSNSSGNDMGMEMPADTATVSIGEFESVFAETQLFLPPGSGLPAARFQAITAAPGNNYATWIDSFFPGETNPAIIGFDQDPDGDNLSNGVEAALGTAPNADNSGIKVISTAAPLTVQSSQAKPPLTDVTAAWQWSHNLVDWYPSGASNGPSSVTISETVTDSSNPGFDVTEVQASVSGDPLPKLFLRLSASQTL